jgi:hypothetical protein
MLSLVDVLSHIDRLYSIWHARPKHRTFFFFLILAITCIATYQYLLLLHYTLSSLSQIICQVKFYDKHYSPDIANVQLVFFLPRLTPLTAKSV